MKKLLSIALAAMLVVFSLAACTSAPTSNDSSVSTAASVPTEASSSEATSAPNGGNTAYPLTITNFSVKEGGSVWEEKDQVFEQAPQRIVCTMQGTAELLVRLGLTDSIVGVAGVMGDVAPDIKEEFDRIPVLSQEYAGQEIIMGADPDIVVGSGYFFVEEDWGAGTVDFLNEAGILTYVMNASTADADFDDFFKDIEELGRIFDVQDAASELISHYKTQMDDLANNPLWSGQTKKLAEVAVVENGSFTVSSGKGENIQNDALALIGLDNIFKDAAGAEVSKEDFIESNPDVILLFWYEGGPDMDTMIEELYQMEELQDITAVKERQIFYVDFNAFYGGSGAIFEEAGRLAEMAWSA